MNEFSQAEETEEPEYSNTNLGEALGNNAELEEFLEGLSNQINEHTPKYKRSKVKGLRDRVIESFGQMKILTIRAYDWVKERFTHQETERVIEKNNEFENQIDSAKSESVKEDVEKEQKEASEPTEILSKSPAVQTTQKIPEELGKTIEELAKYGIGCIAEINEEGKLVVYFAKNSEPDDEVA